MKAVIALLALAASVLAGKEHEGGYPQSPPPSYVTSTEYETTTVCPITETHTQSGSTYEVTTHTTSTITVTSCAGGDCGGGAVTKTLPDTTVGTTTAVEVTYTTTCPVTETVTAPGHTYTTIYTTTSVAVTNVETIIYATVTGPAVTKTAATEVYTTLTSLCPVTETKTIEGETQVVVWTSTSTIHTVVPVTQTAYESYTVTEHKSTEVFTTEICPETTYTTISSGHTIYVTETGTETVTSTKEYVVTETIPVTATKEVDVTKVTEVSTPLVETVYPTVYITHSDTTIVTSLKPYPTTVSAPVTKSVGSTSVYTASPPPPPPPASTSESAPTTVPTALAPHATHAAGAVLVGVAGFFAML
ncbi:hypothetical protein PG993_000532 [Apiospora rasikravindrae]|uniref:Repetitive proline-rich cell wall protein n=1 Tax=Apiospora rasikravindrae TaxID=990691 RepID=A0ABR1U8T9_9PEZI